MLSDFKVALRYALGLPVSECDVKGHKTMRIPSNHIHYQKGEREVCCYSGEVEKCVREKCPFEVYHVPRHYQTGCTYKGEENESRAV